MQKMSPAHISTCVYIKFLRLFTPLPPKKKNKQNKQQTNKQISDHFDILNKDIHQHALIYDILKSLDIHYNC